MTDAPEVEGQAALPVALDAMGGDQAPAVVIQGALAALDEGLGPLKLVGDRDAIEVELKRLGALDREGLEVIHAEQTIAMAEHPGRAARTKRNSSMHLGYAEVKAGRACAFVSAGNTGALMAVGLLTLRRIPRCDRPAVAAVLPIGGQGTVLLDLGANVECRAGHLVQFALMGAAFAEVEMGVTRPRVGLLSNGTEPTKGTETLREAHRLLTSTDLNYLGFVEGREVAQGQADVVVTDGFTGNVALKVAEGMAQTLIQQMREAARQDWLGAVGAFLMRRSLKKILKRLDYASVGGAPLLGVDGVAVAAHGGSNAKAITSAIRAARSYAKVRLPERLKAVLKDSTAEVDVVSTSELPLTRTTGPQATDKATDEGGP